MQKEIKCSAVTNISPDLGICLARYFIVAERGSGFFFRARNSAGKDATGHRRARISGRIPAAIFPRHQLHAFFRTLPADRFPALAALGEHIWADNRDERFTASLDTLVGGLQADQSRPGRQPAS